MLSSLLAPLLLTLSASFPGPIYATTIKPGAYDLYERRLVDTSYVPIDFFASFSTAYSINSKPVLAREFWQHSLRGKPIQVKAIRAEGFWFLLRANLLETK